MKRPGIKYICVFCLSFLLTACSQKEVFSEFHSFPEAEWQRNERVNFKIDRQPDNTQSRDVFLEIRNNNHYPFRNLWLFVDIIAPNGERRCDTINVELADVYGKWHGRGISLYSNSFLYEPEVKYPLPGIYTYSIRQGMREEVLQGISDIGITVTLH
jgi:gliding motility-associated lipoprotein GldH